MCLGLVERSRECLRKSSRRHSPSGLHHTASSAHRGRWSWATEPNREVLRSCGAPCRPTCGWLEPALTAPSFARAARIGRIKRNVDKDVVARCRIVPGIFLDDRDVDPLSERAHGDASLVLDDLKCLLERRFAGTAQPPEKSRWSARCAHADGNADRVAKDGGHTPLSLSPEASAPTPRAARASLAIR